MMVNRTIGSDAQRGPIERSARWIASLDHPFYDDERQRHIWYEASSIGVQLFLQLQLLVAGAAVWIGGDQAAVNYTAAFLGVLGVVSLSMLAYTKFKQAEYLPTASDYKKGPMVMYVTLLVVYGSGVARALQPEETPSASSWLGFGVGIAVCVAVGTYVSHLINKRKSNA